MVDNEKSTLPTLPSFVASSVYTNGYVSVIKMCAFNVLESYKPYDIETTFTYDTETSATLLYLNYTTYFNRTVTVQTTAYCEKEAAVFDPPFTFSNTTTFCIEYDACVNCNVILHYIKFKLFDIFYNYSNGIPVNFLGYASTNFSKTS